MTAHTSLKAYLGNKREIAKCFRHWVKVRKDRFAYNKKYYYGALRGPKTSFKKTRLHPTLSIFPHFSD